MTLQAAPHPPSVFRYLKQAWRDYLASGNAQTLTVNNIPNQAAAAVTTVSGTCLADVSVPQPVLVFGYLYVGATFVASGGNAANPVTGVYVFTFPGGTMTAGTAHVAVFTPYGGVNSNNFTVT